MMRGKRVLWRLWPKSWRKGVSCRTSPENIESFQIEGGIFGAVFGDYMGHPFLYTGMNSINFKHRPEICSPGNCSIFLLSTAVSLTCGMSYLDVLSVWDALILPSPGGGAGLSDWISSGGERRIDGNMGMFSVVGLAAASVFSTEEDALLWVDSFCSQFTDDREILILIKIVLVAGLCLKNGEGRSRMRSVVENGFGIEIPAQKEIWMSGGLEVGARGIDYVRAAISCVVAAEGYESAVRYAISLGGNAQLTATLAGGLYGFLGNVPKELLKDFMERVGDRSTLIGGALVACPPYSVIEGHKPLPVCPGGVASALAV
ncbi:hypothetical protein [Acetobacter malorum]|nr:hypothetical protein [Acetobacter malorum]